MLRQHILTMITRYLKRVSNELIISKFKYQLDPKEIYVPNKYKLLNLDTFININQKIPYLLWFYFKRRHLDILTKYLTFKQLQFGPKKTNSNYLSLV